MSQGDVRFIKKMSKLEKIVEKSDDSGSNDLIYYNYGNEDEDKLLHKDIDRNEYKNENEGKNEIKLEFRTRFSLPIISHFNS